MNIAVKSRKKKALSGVGIINFGVCVIHPETTPNAIMTPIQVSPATNPEANNVFVSLCSLSVCLYSKKMRTSPPNMMAVVISRGR